jgi:hypothetical protein
MTFSFQNSPLCATPIREALFVHNDLMDYVDFEVTEALLQCMGNGFDQL